MTARRSAPVTGRAAPAVARPPIAGRQPASARQPAAAPVLRGPQRARHEPDYVLLLSVTALGALGLLMVYTSSGVNALLQDDPLMELGPQAIWGVLGVIAMFVVMRVDYRYLRLVSVVAFIVAVALLVLVLLPEIGPIKPQVINGSARWLRIGPLPAMHPAEFAKLALVVYLAHWLTRKGARVGSVSGGLAPFLVILGVVAGLVMLEPDLGTTGVLVLTGLTMFFVAGGSLLQLAAVVPAGFLVVAWFVSNSGYQLDRVRVFLDPWAYAEKEGYQTVQGLLALGQGGPLGIGLGESSQPGAVTLPQAHNDFVFALLGQELGFIGGLAVIGLYLLFAYRGIRVALRAPDTFGALLATGITAWLTLQAFINIAVVVVLLPVTGITLPFVSDGGSSLLVSFAAVGILLSISRETLPRGNFNDADPHRRRWYGRPRLPRVGRLSLPARSGT